MKKWKLEDEPNLRVAQRAPSVTPTDLALRELKDSAQMRLDAATRYLNAVKECRVLGLTYTEIARQLGISETAVRLYCKRHEMS